MSINTSDAQRIGLERGLREGSSFVEAGTHSGGAETAKTPPITGSRKQHQQLCASPCHAPQSRMVV